MWVEVKFSLTIICITVGYVWYRCMTIVRCMPKHKSVLHEQAQQINFKSVLNCQNTFKSVFNLLGLFVECTFGEKPFQPISTPHTEKLSIIDYCKENLESCQNLLFCAPSVLPPLSPPHSVQIPFGCVGSDECSYSHVGASPTSSFFVYYCVDSQLRNKIKW